MRGWWRSWRNDLVAVAASALVAASLAVVVGVAMSVLRQWVVLGAAWPGLPWHFIGPHETVAWQVALLAAPAIAWALAKPSSQRVRVRAAAAIAAVGLGLLAVASLPWTSWLHPSWSAPPTSAWDVPIGLLTGAGGCAWIARRRTLGDDSRRRAAIRTTLGLVVAAVALGPSIAETVDARRFQAFPTFRVDFVAADVAAEGTADAAWIDGAWFSLHPADVLAVDQDDVVRIRWTADPFSGRDGITIRFDAPTARGFRARAHQRQGRHDAVMVEGRRFMAVQYEGDLLTDEVGLFVPSDRRDDLAWLYHRLTGLQAPAP